MTTVLFDEDMELGKVNAPRRRAAEILGARGVDSSKLTRHLCTMYVFNDSLKLAEPKSSRHCGSVRGSKHPSPPSGPESNADVVCYTLRPVYRERSSTSHAALPGEAVLAEVSDGSGRCDGHDPIRYREAFRIASGTRTTAQAPSVTRCGAAAGARASMTRVSRPGRPGAGSSLALPCLLERILAGEAPRPEAHPATDARGQQPAEEDEEALVAVRLRAV
jgi:hypothetical protein